MTKRICDQRIKAPAHIERRWMNRLLILNIMKANDLRFDSWSISDDLEKTLNSREIQICEDELMEKEKKLSVLNTSLFCILHQNDYSIPSDEDD